MLARRLAERGLRYIQLFHWGWDSHGASASEALNKGFSDHCKEADQPMTALLKDLKQRGLLEDTLVVWGGEFGRTPMQENRGGNEMAFVGRDHNPGAFTILMAGGGVNPGISYGPFEFKNVIERGEAALALEALEESGPDDIGVVAFGKVMKKVAPSLEKSETPANACVKP